MLCKHINKSFESSMSSQWHTVDDSMFKSETESQLHFHAINVFLKKISRKLVRISDFPACAGRQSGHQYS